MGLFGPSKKEPKEQVKEWTTQLRKENRKLDRQIWQIKREEEKVKRSIKDAAKKGQKDVCRVLAKEIVNSNKAVSKIHCAQAQLKSVEYSMNEQLANVKLAGCLQKSTQVMQSMQQLVKVQEVGETMRSMSKEMMKAGILEEMLEDTMESVFDTDDIEEEVSAEVEKVLWELTKGDLGKAPDAVQDSLPVVEPAEEEGAVGGADEDVLEMQERLQALRS